MRRTSRVTMMVTSLSLMTALLLPACGPADEAISGDEEAVVDLPSDNAIEEALATITEEELVHHVQVLGSDEFGGRAPSSPGEDLTIQYLTEQFARLGLEPGGTDGGWTQEVPLVSITADPNMTLSVAGGGATNTFQYGPDFIAWTTSCLLYTSDPADERVRV